MPSLTVAEIASLLDASAEGDLARLISGAAALADAAACDLSFVSGKQGASAAQSTRAGCLIVPAEFGVCSSSYSLIRVREPRSAFARVLAVLYPARKFPAAIHPSCVISESASIASGCYIGAHVTIGAATTIAGGCVVGDGCVIGDQVTLGPDTMLHPNVTVYERVQIGARVVIHSGTVIGADGFGFSLVEGHYRKFPQVGTVVIHDDVEIGANCCIDRAALGVTRIGASTKLDNLVHIGHNCLIGEDIVIAAQAGFSGSVTVGDFAVIGGQAGIGEKARIETKAIVGGKAGILTGATVHAGEPVWGIPARPLRKHLKGLAHVNKLPELKEEIRQLRQRVVTLERLLKED